MNNSHHKLLAVLFIFFLFSLFFQRNIFASQSGIVEVHGIPDNGPIHIRFDDVEPLTPQPWPLEAGEHSYKITRPGYYPLTGNFVVRPGASVTINYKLEKRLAGAENYFVNIPRELQKRGRWVSLMPVGVGFEYKKDSAGTYNAATKGGLSLSLAQLTLYSPKPYIPLMIGILPVQLAFRGVGNGPRQVGGDVISEGTYHAELASVRSKIFAGTFWTGWNMLLALGLQGWIGGKTIPEFSIFGGGGLFAQFGVLLGNHFMMDIRYDLDIDKCPGHIIQLEMQVNIYGRNRR